LAIDAHDIVLRGIRVFGVSYIADTDPGASDRFQRHVIQLGHIVHEAVGVDVIVERPHFDVARRQNQVLTIHGVDDVHDAEISRKKLKRIDMDHDLPVLSTESSGDGYTGHGHNLVADGKLGKIVKLGLGETSAFYRD